MDAPQDRDIKIIQICKNQLLLSFPGAAGRLRVKQHQALFCLYSHRVIMFDAWRNTGNELEEYN